MRLESLKSLTSFQIPDLDHLVIRGGQYSPIIGLQTSDDPGVTLIAHPVQGLETLVAGHAPHSDGSVQTARDDSLMIFVQGETGDSIIVTLEHGHTVASVQLPQSDGLVPAPLTSLSPSACMASTGAV